MNKLFAVIIALILGAAAANAAPSMGTSSAHDLDALWATAQTTYDLAQEDAVLLLESRRVALGDAGEVATTVQRVVWIGTAAGLRAHADLRVPWNSATCSFEVAKLRTWREGRWWPDAEKLSDTAIVHTLPYAVDHADDYTTMRETMLLHDGVELPCIMETEYTITERGLPGADDVFVMAQRDPAVLVQLTLSAPAARPLHHRELNGAAAPAIDERNGTRTLAWTLQPAAALRLPLTATPSAYEPGVIWSTWTDHRAMGAAWSGAFQAAAVAPPAALDSLRAAVREASGDQARLEAGGRWLDQSVRHIHQDDRWWTFAPRPAVRTWETAYGHGLDRAVLWASLLRGEGWTVTPVLVGQPHAALSSDPPWLTGRGRLLLQVVAPDRGAPGHTAWLCDPADFSVHGDELLVGRELVWLSDECTVDGYAALPGTLAIELSLAAGDSAWTGSGYAAGAGRLAFHHQTAGAADAVATHLGKLADSLVSGAETPAASLTMSTPNATSARFDVTAPFGDPDKAGRRRLVIGRPLGGLLDHLPSDCRLDETGRATPVLMDALGQQAVTVRLHLPAGAVATRPADRAVENAAGTFKLTVTEKDGWLTYDRAVTLGADAGKPENWPALRALLLEEADAANATITWRPAEKKK
jgi:hypothetical protein